MVNDASVYYECYCQIYTFVLVRRCLASYPWGHARFRLLDPAFFGEDGTNTSEDD